MTVRLFRCRCNHRVRFGAQSCSYCFHPTTIANRLWFPALLVPGVVLAALAITGG